MLLTRTRRLVPEINAGSMADIAFLLLIFFLVTTEISKEEGLLVQLPPYDITAPPPLVPPRNLLKVQINAADQLLVNGEPGKIGRLRGRAVEFITNPQQLPTLPKSPTKAVVSLQNDRSTHYATYLAVYNELLGAYRDIWNERAERSYGKTYELLSLEQRKRIRAEVPLVISEAEAVDYGQPVDF